MSPIRPSRGTVRILGLLFGAFAMVGLISASPWALSAFDGPTPRWERLSFIGQTYGAASALLAVLALLGIVATLGLQAHDTKIAREEARRSAIADLLKMAMDDPDLHEAWGPVPEGLTRKAQRQILYINVIVSAWQMSFATGALPEKRLRAVAREMFSGQAGRIYWRQFRELRLTTSEDRRTRRFHNILDEEYHRAPEPPAPHNRRPRLSALFSITATAAAALVLLARTFRYLRR